MKDLRATIIGLVFIALVCLFFVGVVSVCTYFEFQHLVFFFICLGIIKYAHSIGYDFLYKDERYDEIPEYGNEK
jgi:fatty-acid desaturase